MRAKAEVERSTKLGCARVRRGGKEARGTGLVRSGRREAGRAERAAEQANAGRGKELGHRAAGRGRENGKEGKGGAAGPSVGGGRAGRRGRCAGLGRQQWARWSRLG